MKKKAQPVDWYAEVPQEDGFSTVGVHIEYVDGRYLWSYSIGEYDGEVDTLEDSGYCENISDAFEDIAASLCEVGFDTYTDDVENAFSSLGLGSNKESTRKRASLDDETFATLVDEAYADFKQKLEEEWPTIESWDDAVSELYASIDDVTWVVTNLNELPDKDRFDLFDTIWAIFEEEGLTKKWAKLSKRKIAMRYSRL